MSNAASDMRVGQLVYFREWYPDVINTNMYLVAFRTTPAIVLEVGETSEFAQVLVAGAPKWVALNMLSDDPAKFVDPYPSFDGSKVTIHGLHSVWT